MHNNDTLERDLLEQVEHLLGEGGAVSALPHHQYNPQQRDYAIHVAKGLARQDRAQARTSINALQASTGTGKTLGYLVPGLMYAALTGERVLVSTFTRHLQRQVLASAHQVAQWVLEATGVNLRIALRMGMGNFVSANAVNELISMLSNEPTSPDDHLALLDDLLAWTEAREDGRLVNSGMLDDFLVSQGLSALPSGIPVSAVTVSATSPDADKEAYYAHTEASGTADIVIINHALLVAHALRWGALFGDDGRVIGAVLCDEADRLRDAAESMLQSDFTFRHAAVTATVVARALRVDGLSQGADALLSEMQRLGKQAGPSGMVLDAREPLCGEVCDHVQRYLTQAAPAALGLARVLNAQGALLPAAIRRDVAVEFIDQTQRLSQALSELKSGKALGLLSWSPVRAWPSLRLGQAYPARLLSRLWAPLDQADDPLGPKFNLIQSILFTSATLGTPGRALPEAFDDFLQDIGVIRHPRRGEITPIHHVHVDLFASWEPLRFGSLSFQVMDPRVPDPTDRETTETNPLWRTACAEMIAAAHHAGGRTFVLATSFQDAQDLGAVLRAQGIDVAVHARGEPLARLLPDFKASANGVLITPSGWEGIDMPGIINQLVITRIPFGSLESTQLQLLRLGLIQSGMAEDRAQAYVMGRLFASAKRALMQGLGRPIRRATDSATVWIADPRMPLPARWTDSLHPAVLSAPVRQGFSGLLAAIPARFRHDAYHQAKIFTPTAV